LEVLYLKSFGGIKYVIVIREMMAVRLGGCRRVCTERESDIASSRRTFCIMHCCLL